MRRRRIAQKSHQAPPSLPLPQPSGAAPRLPAVASVHPRAARCHRTGPPVVQSTMWQSKNSQQIRDWLATPKTMAVGSHRLSQPCARWTDHHPPVAERCTPCRQHRRALACLRGTISVCAAAGSQCSTQLHLDRRRPHARRQRAVVPVRLPPLAGPPHAASDAAKRWRAWFSHWNACNRSPRSCTM